MVRRAPIATSRESEVYFGPIGYVTDVSANERHVVYARGELRNRERSADYLRNLR
jgi:hypothetical protein